MCIRDRRSSPRSSPCPWGRASVRARAGDLGRGPDRGQAPDPDQDRDLGRGQAPDPGQDQGPGLDRGRDRDQGQAPDRGQDRDLVPDLDQGQARDCLLYTSSSPRFEGKGPRPPRHQTMRGTHPKRQDFFKPSAKPEAKRREVAPPPPFSIRTQAALRRCLLYTSRCV